MADLRQIHERSLRGFQIAMEEAASVYRQCELANDVDGAAAAAQQLAGLRASVNELNSMAREAYVQQMPRANANKYGLSADEVTIAHGMSGGDRTLSNDERERSYAEQKARLQHMRATGEYRDDQGQVRR